MRTLNIDNVARFLGHPAIYPSMADDYAQAEMVPQAAQALVTSGVWALQPSETSLFMLFPRTVTMWEVHVMVMPEGRGRQAIEDGRNGLAWLFENTPCEKVIAYIPEFNPQALLLAKRVGFVVEGTITKSFRKDGVLHDMKIVGITKEALCQS